ncbi:pre-16S rRNA-processing nuclease YqgF [Roseofilum sp. BLCC_M154]|uniref:Pre-16S rRNA-processing nuclease YqgF n=1 Tax=Roseofilum acuticapitatum BLCC-M154 TaxID=3022444 RepID=A0ABT7AY95_9CYAN|nr:pre-16S rRNA-processing nuclease YqgF [Roseofilum acuticapitatum]MDJ1171886.1 pre-16S rRNA-processing nuclease YqgF [Roseofilum acuticapitatum BLCC-M154]
MILGFDPGKDKCGIAVMSEDRQVWEHEVVASDRAIATLKLWCQQYGVSVLVMGNQTTSKAWEAKLKPEFADTVPIIKVDERYSTLEARDRYWLMYPPQGFTRLIPQGMRQPPRPIDDIVAIILIERYFASF